MSRSFRVLSCTLAAIFLLPVLSFAGEAGGQRKDTCETIDYLINTIAQSHLTFIRNGERHTSEEASRHVRAKYDYLQSRIKTPEEFISYCASKSSISGSPYLVVTEQGNIPVEKWLRQVLTEYRKSRNNLP